MSGHTPGPWTRCKSTESGGSFITHIDAEYVGHDVCFVYASHGMFDPVVTTEQDDANANLIAAAPELLESLESVLTLARLKWGNLDKDAWAEFEKARAAIAKAKGE
jgi:hypothetical protein